VIGSIAPDLAYFLPLGVGGSYTHTLEGVLLFCLPAGVAAWAIFRLLLGSFLLALLPRFVCGRLPHQPPEWSARLLAAVAVSVLVGSATHVVWDSFTHSTGFVVRLMPVMSTPMHLFEWYQPRLFTALQHVSTLGGLTILLGLTVRWFHGTAPIDCNAHVSLPIWPRLLAVAALVLPSAAAGLAILHRHLADASTLFPVFQNYLGRAIFSAGTVFLGMLLLLALVWRAWVTWSVLNRERFWLRHGGHPNRALRTTGIALVRRHSPSRCWTP
jgi:hypothetical protein